MDRCVFLSVHRFWNVAENFKCWAVFGRFISLPEENFILIASVVVKNHVLLCYLRVPHKKQGARHIECTERGERNCLRN